MTETKEKEILSAAAKGMIVTKLEAHRKTKKKDEAHSIQDKLLEDVEWIVTLDRKMQAKEFVAAMQKMKIQVSRFDVATEATAEQLAVNTLIDKIGVYLKQKYGF